MTEAETSAVETGYLILTLIRVTHISRLTHMSVSLVCICVHVCVTAYCVFYMGVVDVCMWPTSVRDVFCM